MEKKENYFTADSFKHDDIQCFKNAAWKAFFSETPYNFSCPAEWEDNKIVAKRYVFSATIVAEKEEFGFLADIIPIGIAIENYYHNSISDTCNGALVLDAEGEPTPVVGKPLKVWRRRRNSGRTTFRAYNYFWQPVWTGKRSTETTTYQLYKPGIDQLYKWSWNYKKTFFSENFWNDIFQKFSKKYNFYPNVWGGRRATVLEKTVEKIVEKI